MDIFQYTDITWEQLQEKINELISKNIDLNVYYKGSVTLLGCAAAVGDEESVGRLLENGADPNFISFPFINFISNFAEAFWFKEGYVDINAKNNRMITSKYSPLHYAAAYGYISIAKLLLDKKANIDVQAPKRGFITPLHLAVISEHIEMVKFLLKKGANIHLKLSNYEAFYSETAFYYAVKLENADIVLAFLEEKADEIYKEVSKEDKRLKILYQALALWEKQPKIATILLKNNLNIYLNLKNPKGNDVIDYLLPHTRAKLRKCFLQYIATQLHVDELCAELWMRLGYERQLQLLALFNKALPNENLVMDLSHSQANPPLLQRLQQLIGFQWTTGYSNLAIEEVSKKEALKEFKKTIQLFHALPIEIICLICTELFPISNNPKWLGKPFDAYQDEIRLSRLFGRLLQKLPDAKDQQIVSFKVSK